jgi:hypothetical protein
LNISFDEIYVIKTSYGDELVTKIIAEDELTYTLTKPLVVIAGPQGVQMISGVVTGDPEADVTLFKAHCAMIVVARREVSDGYIETTTGIKPVSSKILMG